MTAPAFFAQLPTITLHDPLAEFLGASSDGLVEYRYLDAVKLAGHSCPTVAGAWLMTARALERLYPTETPQRGGIKVELRGAAHEGVVGVIANVMALVTGAAGEGGFKGIAGRFERRGLLSFGAPIEGEARFTRTDTGRSVEASFNGDAVPARPETRVLLQRALGHDASPEERAAFAAAWQERVARILVERRDDPGLVRIVD
jgi:hypothetical protein